MTTLTLEQKLEIIRLVITGFIPVIILFIGRSINKTLENNKAVLSKEKDWQNWWAGKFLSIAHDINSTVSECVTGLFILNQVCEEKLLGWEDDVKQKENALCLDIRKLQYLGWEIQNFTQFASTKGNDVSNYQNQLFDLVGNLLKKKSGDLEKIRLVQFAFNESARLAHAEILEITPYKTMSRHS